MMTVLGILTLPAAVPYLFAARRERILASAGKA